MLPRKTPLKRGQSRLKRTRLAPISPKKLPAAREYTKLAKEFKAAHPICHCCGTRKARDVHHTRGRGKFLNDVTTWLSVCRICHDWIHAHANEAREKGWLF